MTIHSHRRISEASGKADVQVRLEHIQRALKAIRCRALKDKPDTLPEPEALEPMDVLSFDEIVMAATLVATVESVMRRSDNLWQFTDFIEALVREGASSVVGHWPTEAEVEAKAKARRTRKVAGSFDGPSRQTE